MFFGLLLLSVVVVSGYFGGVVLLKFGPAQRAYGWMLVADFALALIAFLATHHPDSRATGDLLGAVAIGGATCLLIVPPILQDLARRALVRDRLRIAKALVDVRELLQPGMGARQERELIEAVIAVRGGKVDAAVDLLRQRRVDLDDPRARRHIDERIVMTYLYARRWQDAVDAFEKSFERTLGGPQLAVEMIRAYCEVGDVETAAALVAHIEVIGSEEPMMAFLVHRARLVLLAFLGRTGAVESLVADAGPLGHMPASARSFWSGVARLNAGDRAGARAALGQAVKLSGHDVRARDVAAAALAQVEDDDAVGPRAVPPAVAELADKLTAAAAKAKAQPRPRRVPSFEGVGWRQIPVTSALIALNVIAFATVSWVFGSTSDLGVLAQAGANLKSAVFHGEAWRLVSCMFLHVGYVHIGLNMYGLWILGKLMEQLYGRSRFFVLYMLAGIGGSIASVLFGGAAMSVGASGAVFGLLGASTAELGLHRHAYPERWRRMLFWNLLFLAAANIAIAFEYPEIDQAAHLGGMVVGAVLVVLLSPEGRWARARVVQIGARVAAVACVAALVYGAFGAVTTTYPETLARYPQATRVVGGVAVSMPSCWESATKDEVDDANSLVTIFMHRYPKHLSLADAIAIRLRVARNHGAKQAGFDKAETAPHALLKVPAPWRVQELAVSASDGMGGRVHFRAAVFGRVSPSGDELWVGTMYYPASLASGLHPAVARMLESARPAEREQPSH